MLIPETAWSALLDQGIRISEAGPHDIVMTSDQHPSETRRFQVKAFARQLGPREIQRLVQSNRPNNDTSVLLITPVLSDASRQALARAGWSWLTTSGQDPELGSIRMKEHTIRLRTHPEGDSDVKPGSRRGKTPWGALEVARQLLTGERLTQADLVQFTTVKQARISQLLSDFADRGWVGRIHGHPISWQVTHYEALLDWWLRTYPGPGGVSTYWTSLDDIPTQVIRAHNALSRATHLRAHPLQEWGDSRSARPIDRRLALEGIADEPLVSGDAAADRISPWRRPVRALIYTRHGADLTREGFTPVPPGAATLEVSTPQDPGLWPTPPLRRLLDRLGPGAPLPMADPFQVLYDLSRAPGPDVDQAVAALRQTIVNDVAFSALGPRP